MNELSIFQKFGRVSKTALRKSENKFVLAYTRVSSKDQKDKNCSLETQRVAIEEYAKKHGLTIIEYFGGTYESAKSDGRKEFQRMLEYINKHKGQISTILVYNMSRFSRTGGQGIAIADELRQKHNVHVHAITQPTDTTNPNGILFQDMQLIFSRWDNEQRKQNAVAGMKTKFNKGEWVVKPPFGYDIIRINNVRKIVVNEQGKLLKKAFEWKARGMDNQKILTKLNVLGLTLYKQKLTKILANPFYCGLMRHGMLDGKVIEGNHEKLISKELFLKVNDIVSQAPKFGVHHSIENEALPLKKFISCLYCGKPFTGYIVKEKGIYYYKCRTTGCKCNKSAKKSHTDFENMLGMFQLDKKYIEPLQHHLEYIFQESIKENAESEKSSSIKLKELGKKIEVLEEKYFLTNNMDKDTFDRLMIKLQSEKNELINQNNVFFDFTSSNLSKCIKTSLQVSSNLSSTWALGNLTVKENLQKLVFPDGILYDKQNDGFRTEKINSVFLLIADLARDTGQNKKGQKSNKTQLSLSAERAGLY